MLRYAVLALALQFALVNVPGAIAVGVHCAMCTDAMCTEQPIPLALLDPDRDDDPSEPLGDEESGEESPETSTSDEDDTKHPVLASWAPPEDAAALLDWLHDRERAPDRIRSGRLERPPRA